VLIISFFVGIGESCAINRSKANRRLNCNPQNFMNKGLQLLVSSI